jgi:predicted transcriptional regulator
MPATLADIQRKYGDSVYPLYKDEMHEPYMENNHLEMNYSHIQEVKKAKEIYNKVKSIRKVAKALKTSDRKRVGKLIKEEVTPKSFGYQGIVLYDELEDKVQCSECGEWFEALQAHVRIKHKKTVGEYKADFGINRQTPICSKKVSETLSKVAKKSNLARFKFKKGHYIKPPRTSIKRRIELSKIGKQSTQTKNQHGLCDAQIAARLVVVRDMAGRKRVEDITSRDFSKYDRNLYQAMRNRFGTFAKACKSLDIEYIGQKKYSDSEMIAKLRTFVIKHKRIPSTKLDLNSQNNIPTYDAYKAHFGSWHRAKIMGGLDQLL